MTITERVFDLLSKQHKTDASLCGHLGIKSNVIANWKKTNTIPPAKYLVSISEFLGVSCDYLLTGKEAADNISADEQDLLSMYRSLPSCVQREVLSYIKGSCAALSSHSSETVQKKQA